MTAQNGRPGISPAGRTITPPSSVTISEQDIAGHRQDDRGTVPYANSGGTAIAFVGAERELLGALLVSSSAAAQVILERLRDDDLTLPAHAIVLRAIRRLADAGLDVGPVSVLGELRRTGEIASTALGLGDGAAGVLLAELYGSAPVPLAAGHRLRIVLEHSARRRVQAAGLRLCQAAESGALAGVADIVSEELSAALAALGRGDSDR